jgi:hypothetical protein
MILDAKDHMALRVAEQAVLRTTTHTHIHAGGRLRRAVAMGVRRDPGFDPARLDALADAGLLEDLLDDSSPERGRRRLVATERGRLEWRFAAAEDQALAMEMDDVFHADGDVVVVEIADRRYVDVGTPPPDGAEWTTSHSPACEEAELPAMDVHERRVAVEAFANARGERLLSWNCRPSEPVMHARFGPHSTGATYGMTGATMSCLHAAASHQLYYAGGHTHFTTRCGTAGCSMSSSSRNLLLRFGMIKALPVPSGSRREDYVATDRGRRLLGMALAHVDEMSSESATRWAEYQRALARARAAA